jgi:hypothetical protein
MTLEQNSELNRFVDPSIPLTWKWRWCQIKMTLPIWVFSFACVLEMVLFKAWLSDKLSFGHVLTWLGYCLFALALLFGIIEAQVRIRQRSKRVIRFESGKIFVQPAKNQLIRWNSVAKFQFEPVPEAPKLTKMKLFLRRRPNKKSPARAYWAMVLQNQSQMQELTRYLQTKKTETPTNYEIEILDRPRSPEYSAPFPFLGLSLGLGGMYLLLHGVPMLLAVINRNHHESDETSKLSPEESAKLGQFILKHFSSQEQFNHFFLILSISMIVVGIFMMALGWRLMNSKSSVMPSSRTV